MNNNIIENLPVHIAVIMDGNRRWAKSKGLTAKDGHTAGAKTLENIAKYCNEIGIKYLTVYAFSTENWKRTKEEVNAIMTILKLQLKSIIEKDELQNVKINFIGNIHVLQKGLRDYILKVIEKTKNNTGLVLNIALNYGGREELVMAMKQIAKKVKSGEINIEDINEELITNNLYTAGQPEPDLLIRTSNELRLSNFLPWQLTYSEFYFCEKNWPEFDEQDLMIAIEEYQRRNRRFGGK